MNWLENLAIAFHSLRGNKLRSSLTILGIIVGIFSIISISTIITMLKNSIESGFSMLGKNTFQIQKYPAMNFGRMDERIRNRKNLTIEEYYLLKDRLIEAKSVGAEQWEFARLVKYGKAQTNPNIQLCGLSPEAQPNNKWDVKEGRPINENDIQHNMRVCILGADVADYLFKHIYPIGQEVTVDGAKYTVIGVYERQGSMFGESQDGFMTIPISTYQAKYGKYDKSVNITVMSHNAETYNLTIESAIGYMRIIRKVKPGEDNNFDIFSNESMINQVMGITKYAELGAFVVAFIALLAAGVGIMNIMLVTVTERTREIGIRKAIGAKSYQILMQFVIEAIILCQVGGIIGIVLGVGVGNMAGSFLNAQPSLPMDWIVIGVSLCIIVGVVFGTYPAWKASRFNPIDALRYE